MLEVQKYLQTHSLSDLKEEYGVTAKQHNALPLVILNYSMIESPKTANIVRECRSLVLNSEDYSLVARSFYRFFNWGEHAEEMKLFNTSSFHTYSKEDGSLIMIYNFEGEWIINSRNSFGDGPVHESAFTWEELVLSALNLQDKKELDDYLNPKYCYVCELCSKWNKVVRHYRGTKLFLLSVFEQEREFTFQKYMLECITSIFDAPIILHCTSIDEVFSVIRAIAEKEPCFEGFVVRDSNNYRWKVKNTTYLSAARIAQGAGSSATSNMLPFVLSGNIDEYVAYFPEAKEDITKLHNKVMTLQNEIVDLWNDNFLEKDDKKFAMAVKDHPMSSILFTARKKRQSVIDLFRERSSFLLKVLENSN